MRPDACAYDGRCEVAADRFKQRWELERDPSPSRAEGVAEASSRIYAAPCNPLWRESILLTEIRECIWDGHPTSAAVSHGSARPIEFHPPRTQCFSDASFSSVAANLLSNRWRLCVRWLVAGVRWIHRSPKSGAGAVEISEFSGYGKGKVPATLVKLPLLEFVK